jgi:predicted amidohydrolase
MIIGYIQFEPVLGRPNATIEKLDRLISDAANADLIVLPELCNSGYNFESAEMAWETSEEIGNSNFINYLEDKCNEYNLFISSGFNERDDKFLYNSAILVGPKGYVGKYRKLHLFMNEKDYFIPGNAGLPIFDIGLCRVGLLVCFDWIFPEVWRILALKGADVICHPSNLVLQGFAQKAIPVYALINRVFIITCNRIGAEGSLSFTGLSLIASPEGVTLCEASNSNSEIGIAKINLDLARDKMITARNQIFEDRRPEEYRLLVEQQVGREDFNNLKG